MTPGRVIAETKDLSIGYHSRRRVFTVMENLSLRAHRGELVALIGRNGTGKSTLLRTLVGLQPPLGGTIILDGRALHETGSSEMPRLVSFTSTEPMTVHYIRVRDVVSLGRFPHTNWIGTLTEADRRAVDGALEATGITALAQRTIDNISDGERQRTMIARSLAQDTGLMVMDEPTAFLDLPSRYATVNLLRRVTRESGKCVIYSTHDLDTAINEADRIWLMTEDGVSEGAPEDLMLTGSIARAFESPQLSFSSGDGSFSFVRTRHSSIALEGKGRAAKLTARALSRCGYNIESQASMTVRVSNSAGGTEWIVTEGQETESFDSLYDLVTYLSARSQ
ncbi:MAG: ABC transporter ATP-binding protein [Bacteroidales bacterium]|jgi:iron complex transport system ATP-binding protein|nr:ABC transporter ATP-binding protein [Bacteroidales bacterium]MDD3737327.1 ABC transporter ATP-binding protein [Bacteroidales bacterium]HNT93242.1 ABC transporter ATP-binding protein [Bacteroidales bacterium]HOO65883.1 ABC transporter ATP-binding protein [Bacteroidales bacterium]HPQ63369.1 ABC transporter ATP-binding protein [Bacteroidales bacterium]